MRKKNIFYQKEISDTVGQLISGVDAVCSSAAVEVGGSKLQKKSLSTKNSIWRLFNIKYVGMQNLTSFAETRTISEKVWFLRSPFWCRQHALLRPTYSAGLKSRKKRPPQNPGRFTPPPPLSSRPLYWECLNAKYILQMRSCIPRIVTSDARVLDCFGERDNKAHLRISDNTRDWSRVTKTPFVRLS